MTDTATPPPLTASPDASLEVSPAGQPAPHAPHDPAPHDPARHGPAQHDPAPSGRTAAAWRRLVFTAGVGTLVVALLCNAFLELLQSGGDVGRLFSYTLYDTPSLFLLSGLVVWVALLGLVALTGRLWLPMGLFVAASALVGLANLQKLQVRQEPVYPSDVAFLDQAGFLTEMVGTGPLVLTGAFAALVLLVFGLLGRIAARGYPPVRRRTDGARWRRVLVARVVTVALVLAFFSYLSGFNQPGNKVREAYEAAGAHWAFWYQKVNYGRNGFLGGFLYNLGVPAMREPAGYSAETMARLSRRYAALAEAHNRGRAGSLEDVNVVVVLSEALSDPTTLEGVTLEEDPIPFTRSLMQRTRSGQMLAQLYGGGTANMEFEALTGLSLSQFLPQMNSPYQMLVPETPTFPSAVGWFARQGHEPVAVHPYMTSMYKRYAVYPTLGFSEFVHEDTMAGAEHIDENDFVSDRSAFAEVLRTLERSEDPAFVNLVTMQNHYPMAGKYDDPIGFSGVTGETAEHLGHYARGLRHTDDALRDFIGTLERSEERTAVVVYGDHAPGIWAGEVYDRNGDDAFRRTPYLLWTNFRDLPAATEPVTSPIYFLPLLLDDLGVPLPPYYALLEALHEEIPAMEQGEYYLPDGRRVTEEELPDRAKELLADYRLVQYDLAVGERHAQDELFYPEG